MTDDSAERRGSRWSKGLIISGIVIAILNMALAWVMMFSGAEVPAAESLSNAAESALHASEATSTPADKTHPGRSDYFQRKNPKEANAFVDRLMRLMQTQLASENRRTITVLGFCFALISIGFSLFVMGIEGAISMKGTAGDFGALLVKTSSPGLFCILMATLLVAIAYRTKAPEVEPEPLSRADILNAEAEAKERIIEAETLSRERIIEANTQAKERLFEAESSARMKRPAMPEDHEAQRKSEPGRRP
jgi:hypothetical protein